MLTNHYGLAKISGKPGKTRLINHFLINENWYLVDLPGYGYAKLSKTERIKLQKIIDQSLTNRMELVSLFVLLDIRHEPQPIDLEFMEKLGLGNIPFSMVFTKSDKLTQAVIESNIEAYRREMLQHWEELPPIFVTSASKKTGRDQLLNYIEELNNQFVK
jgi:GTP-binding protein